MLLRLLGTGLSEGNWTFWKAAADDGRDTMSWIAQQPWSDGTWSFLLTVALYTKATELISNGSQERCIKLELLLMAYSLTLTCNFLNLTSMHK